MTMEYTARLSRAGDKILCGRPVGERGHCDGLIARVWTNLVPRTRITLERGEVQIGSDRGVPIYGLSPRAEARVASGREVTGRTPWQDGAKLLPIVSLEVDPPFRKHCPSCGVLVFVPPDVLG